MRPPRVVPGPRGPFGAERVRLPSLVSALGVYAADRFGGQRSPQAEAPNEIPRFRFLSFARTWPFATGSACCATLLGNVTIVLARLRSRCV